MPVLRRHLPDALLVALAAVVTVSVLVGDDTARVTVSLCSGLSLLVFLARGWQPLTATVASFGLQAVSLALDPTSNLPQFVASLLTFSIAGAVNRGRDLVVAATAGVAFLLYATLGLPTSGGPADFVLSALIALGFLAAGWQVSRRGRLLEQAREDAVDAEARSRRRTREALADERARIARELHDVVSHGLSVVVVQTQAARTTLDDQGAMPADLTGRLAAVEETAREALGDMRRMLGLLQVDGVVPPDEHEVLVLSDLATLVERARSAGCRVTADLPDPAAPVAAGVGLAAYRIVQESVTNIVKHAPGSAVDLQVSVGPDAIRLRVRNTTTTGASPPRPDGHGLIGMRERAATYGGRCHAGLDEDGCFEVRAAIPLAVEGEVLA